MPSSAALETMVAAEQINPDMSKRVKWTRCKYCGAKLKRDSAGQYCPTRTDACHIMNLIANSKRAMSIPL